jgi:predicted 3-demethylubiquinone-9 3-methyltransferase (glyoxalase superfamily)
MAEIRKIRTCLWFEKGGEDALAFYAGLFDDGAVLSTSDGPGGGVMTATARFGGQEVIALNGGPHFALTPAFSFSVTCDDQTEVDRLWDALLADGGAESRCGWLRDRFGVSWQIIPRRMYELMDDQDPDRRGRVFAAMMGMVKLDVAALEAAAKGGDT